MERGLRIALLGVVGVLLAGAGYLYLVRGPAILVDLAAATRGFFCF